MTGRTEKRVLIVEDEYLIAVHLEDMLTDLGHQVVGPARRIEEALDMARSGAIDFAMLDVNLAGTESFPIADVLRQRGIPFVFATGYGSDGLVDGYLQETALRKPIEQRELAEALARAADRPATGPR